VLSLCRPPFGPQPSYFPPPHAVGLRRAALRPHGACVAMPPSSLSRPSGLQVHGSQIFFSLSFIKPTFPPLQDQYQLISDSTSPPLQGLSIVDLRRAHHPPPLLHLILFRYRTPSAALKASNSVAAAPLQRRKIPASHLHRRDAAKKILRRVALHEAAASRLATALVQQITQRSPSASPLSGGGRHPPTPWSSAHRRMC